jgi:hypothetical protein
MAAGEAAVSGIVDPGEARPYGPPWEELERPSDLRYGPAWERLEPAESEAGRR